MKNKKKIEIVLGFACNNNCKFCSVGRRNTNRTTSDIKKEISRAIKEDPYELNFTGGEPTIRKDIFELVKYAKSKIDKIRVTTNGRMFYYKDFTKKIVKCGLTGAIFSIHGDKPEIHDYLSSVNGAFEQAIKGIENLSEYSSDISINTVITTKNYKSLPNMVNFLINKFNIGSFCFIYPEIDGTILFHKELIVEYEKVSPIIEKLIDITKKNNIPAWVMNIPACFLTPKIRNLAFMKLRTKMYWPDMDTDLDSKKAEDRIKMKDCEKCKFYNICKGIPKKYIKIKNLKKIKPIIGEKLTESPY